LFLEVLAQPGAELCVDLEAQAITDTRGRALQFTIDAAIRRRLLDGLDDIGVTLQHADEIREFERQRSARLPWL
jgi:3-isopropylmalate/(R)-2-methylmalate dehydratase small subunit